MNTMGTAIQDKKHQAAGIVEDVKNKASAYFDEANIDDTLAQARELLDTGAKSVTSFYNDSVKTLEKGIKDRPVVALACAFGAGIATIALVRSLMSSREAR